MDDEERELQSAVEDIVDDMTAQRLLAEAAGCDAYELRATISRIHRDQIGARNDIATLRRDLTEGFTTMHTRFAVVHRDMARIVTLLERLAHPGNAA